MIGRTNAGGGGGGSSKLPSNAYSYEGGQCTYTEDANGWKLKFLSSGTLTLKKSLDVDVFCVGGGGAGYTGVSTSGGGGGGGYTKTESKKTLAAGTYEIVVGTGADVGAEQGGTTSAFGISVEGGYSGTSSVGGAGGSGGGAGGSAANTQFGGSDGYDGGNFDTGSTFRAGGAGQRSAGKGGTTREFGEDGGELYAGGGGGSNPAGSVAGGKGGGGAGGGVASGATIQYAAENGEAGTGGGGGGFYDRNSTGASAGAGGSGIVIIRNAGGTQGNKVAITVYGAKNETVSYVGASESGTITLNENGMGTATVAQGDYTFTGGISGYSATYNVPTYKTILVRPKNAVYWYGVLCDNLTFYSAVQSSQTFAQNDNDVSLTWGKGTASGVAAGMFRTSEAVDFSGFSNINFRCAWTDRYASSNMPTVGYYTSAITAVTALSTKATLDSSLAQNIYQDITCAIASGKTSGWIGVYNSLCSISVQAIWLT